MREFKFQLDKNLWERFYRAFPGHGERSTLLRKVIRNIVSLKAEHKDFSEVVSERIWEDLKDKEEEEESKWINYKD